MLKESNAMKEIHKIQREIFETTKNMTINEELKFYKEEANEAKKMLEEIRKQKRKVG